MVPPSQNARRATRPASNLALSALLVAAAVLYEIDPSSGPPRVALAQEQPVTAAAAANDNDSASVVLGLPPCDRTSLELHRLGADEGVEPCVIYDVHSSPADEDSANLAAEVTMVQVTPANCHNHRDGAVTGVEALNADNGGRGGAIGFNGNYYVKFRFVAVVAGNHLHLGSNEYSIRHIALLEYMLETLRPQYIVGTCSFQASLEKESAEKYGTVVMAQVGPPGFYKETASPPSNPYVFGIHVNSDTYPLPALKSLNFHIRTNDHHADKNGPAAQPLRVVYRTKSEFFYSTCRSLINEALNSGFSDTLAIEYDPDGDDDGDGVINALDEDFLRGLADEACPPGSSAADHFHPALFGCVLSDLEADTILTRWKENGCRPVLTWLTPSTWGWAGKRQEEIPYFQGGGQWHKNFDYSDKYFESGQAVIDHNEQIFGYAGSYDMVVCYAIPILFYHHIASVFLIVDDPDVEGVFRDSYEEMRRGLLTLNAGTIFGPVSFDSYQRNIGRAAAGMQWVQKRMSNNFDPETAEEGEGEGEGEEFIQACVSPLPQAEAATIVPAPSSMMCDAGFFVSNERVMFEASILWDKCKACPVDTYSVEPNERLQCAACPGDSTTEGKEGSTNCIQVNSNLLTPGLVIMGYVMVANNWALALGFMVWIYRHKDDAVVKIGQIQYLYLICIGVIISTATIVALGIQAGFGEDTSKASAACQAAPFLYSIGWVIAYSSLTAKSYRLYKMFHNPQLRRITVTARQTFKIVAAALVLDLAVLISWQVVDPLRYERWETGRSLDSETGVIIIETVGQCRNSNGIWPFAGPLMGIHASLLIVTNILLYKVRGVAERYQEQKYVGLASFYVCEMMLIGLPVMLAVRDSAAATYIALVGIVFLNDSGVLCLIFVPKVLYQREGLPDGVSVAQSIVPSRINRRSSLAHTHISNEDLSTL